MRVAIIGGGAAGLASARHVLGNGHECDVLEMGSHLGGTWVYTDDVGKDKYGFPVYSAMYKGLRTNLPKEVMGFPDFPIPEQRKSYLTQAEILDFLNLYADNFELRKNIKFNRLVVKVTPLPDHKWKVVSVDKPSKEEIEQIYDSVMVCNGHYNDPVLPTLVDLEKFEGKECHSQSFRSPESFKGQRVLIIGAGPSGIDLALQISRVASKVVLSHHLKEPITAAYSDNVEQKPDVKRVLGAEDVEFVDGSVCAFDAIFYCTGYKYSFPFLDQSCGITVVDNHIEPLYKHMIHIERPTMCFIGIPFNVCAFQMFDLQARFFLKYLNGTISLPSRELMLEDTENDMKNRWAKGYSKRQAHSMGPDQCSYYRDLAQEAKTEPIPPVIVKLRDESVKRLYDDLVNFREDRYRIVDENNFIKVQ
ncbi:PREDICTED: senecionine N-oxygenase-like [Nicrophorus vespilloides]|uniref:Flavin-containing monooxygenase n=1 Tax=Nicrophorus vespilloides TaxID=110193 RepID=A0ABM1M9Y5_NICVS|nr:PREDICTED: senecionine N-oxygenase-like [Nicrophorus vespilloides]